MRYQVAVWHGEHRSLFYVIDTIGDDETVSFRNRAEAEAEAKHRNSEVADAAAEAAYERDRRGYRFDRFDTLG